MNRQARTRVTALALTIALGGLAQAQSNLIPGTDVRLAKMDTISALGREGVFPTGLNGVAMATTCCNKGTVKVPWEAPMQEDHPLIAFIVTREADGRMTQVNDYSYVKHGFFALTDNFCDICGEGPGGGGDVLGLGCSDTYATSNNGDNYWLGPPSEIDPWLGDWEATCSHFDAGEPSVTPPSDCDGFRSLSFGMASALNPVGHRMNITDQEFLISGNWFYQGHYVVRGEPEADRENNWGTRPFAPTWSGSKWNLNSTGAFVNGSVLTRWSGATINSVKNGDDDGRVYVAAKVTGPVEGMYHYEYAFQNRDNFRGIGDISIPMCDSATVENFGSSDVDTDAGNNWTATINTSSIDISAGGNPLRWNTIYNVWFDSDASPGDVSMTLDQFDAGGGAASMNLMVAGPQRVANPILGPGCSSGSSYPSLYTNGEATLPAPGFELISSGNVAGNIHLMVISGLDGSISLGGGCTQWFLGSVGAGALLIGSTTSDGGGVATHPAPVPNDPSFEGLHVNAQGAGLNPAGGPLAGFWELTSGLQVRLGNAFSDCP